MKAPIRAAIWDFGGVLVRTEDPGPRRDLEASLGLAAGSLEAMVCGGDVGKAAAVGAASDQDVWTALCARLDLPPTERLRLETEFFAGDRLDHELIDFIRRLRARLRTGLLSNAFPSLRAALHTRYPIADAFDAIVVSAEEGVVKPHPAIYQAALTRLGVSAPEAVFIDDFEENCAGARAVGLQAIRFESRSQAIDAVGRLLPAEP